MVEYDGLNYVFQRMGEIVNKKTKEKHVGVVETLYPATLKQAMFLVREKSLVDDSVDTAEKLIQAIDESTSAIVNALELTKLWWKRGGVR